MPLAWADRTLENEDLGETDFIEVGGQDSHAIRGARREVAWFFHKRSILEKEISGHGDDHDCIVAEKTRPRVQPFRNTANDPTWGRPRPPRAIMQPQ